MALGAVAGLIGVLTAANTLSRFWVRARAKGAMDRDEFRRTIVIMCFLGVWSGLASGLFMSAMWVDSVEAFPPRSIVSYVQGAFYSAGSFAFGCVVWLIGIAGTAFGLVARLPWDNDSEPTP